jgi:hypothetical protein|tara:strand:+ start:577 stop:819 length:243 start_codon:yes stop_codon:yes gene_type:complete
MTYQQILDKVIKTFDGEIMVPNQWRVDGSNGKHYTVTWDKYHRQYSCTCLGYTYRRKCRHITELSNSFALKKGVSNVKNI